MKYSEVFVMALSLLSIYAPAAAAQNDSEVVTIPTEHAPGSQFPSAAVTDVAVRKAADYLVFACVPDGRFVYRVNSDTGELSGRYNIIRHAGALYALAATPNLQNNPGVKSAIDRAASFLQQNYIGHGPESGQLAVWSRPFPDNSTAELGATGLGLVALSEARRLNPNSVSLSDLQALGRFILFLQRSDGSFTSRYSAIDGAALDFESLYYPDEAALGLISLYELDHSPVWLNAAAQALSYLAKRRAGISDVPPDAWALIATAKLLPHYAESKSPASREELIQHAMQICQVLMKNQLRNPPNPALDGSFDAIGRTAPTAAHMEGLLAALEFLPRGTLWDEIRNCVDHGISFLLRAQISSGPYAGGMPAAYVRNTPAAADIRIDFVQHAMCAWIRYGQLLKSEQVASPVPH